MKTDYALVILQALAVQSIRILQGNDDGWAELYTRTFGDALRATGHHVVLSAPAQDHSGKTTLHSKDEPATYRQTPCHYDSCPANSGFTGYNASQADLNWVNSSSVTAIAYGINKTGPNLWAGEAPELVVMGPNVGRTMRFWTRFWSNTVRGAVYAVNKAGIPAIVFSGGNHGYLRWDTDPVPKAAQLYADLASNLTNTIIAGGKPYLPEGVFLNVNFPDVSKHCPDVASYKWFLSRVTMPFGGKDLDHCKQAALPQDWYVHRKKYRNRCFITVTIGEAKDRTTIDDLAKQRAVADKLKSLISCFPDVYQ